MPELLIEGGRFSGLPFFVSAGRGRGRGWASGGHEDGFHRHPVREQGWTAFKQTAPRLLDENVYLRLASPAAGQSFECVPSQSAPLELFLQPQK